MAIIAACMVPHPPLIVPEVGRGSERQIEATRDAYRRVAADIAALKPETVIVSSPHATMYADYFHISPGAAAEGSFARFRAPQVRFQETYDAELAKTVERLAIANGLSAGTRGQRRDLPGHAGIRRPGGFDLALAAAPHLRHDHRRMGNHVGGQYGHDDQPPSNHVLSRCA